MTKREENESVEAIAKRKATIATIILALIFFAMFVFLCVVRISNSTNILATVIICLIVGLIFYGLIVFSYEFLKETWERDEMYKSNEKTVMNKLSKIKYTRVIPKDNKKVSKEFLDDLQNKRNAEFYAKLIEEVVQVVIKYKSESRYIEYEKYEPGYFMDYYEIVEN